MSKKCVIEGCNKKHYANGYCRKHNSRRQYSIKHGIIFNQSIENLHSGNRFCSIFGCNKKYMSLGLCSLHYQRSKDNLPMDYIRQYNFKPGNLNPRWNGGTSEYINHGLLKKIREEKLKLEDYKCQICRKEADRTHHLDRSKSNHDINNLIALCNKCHMEYFHRQPATTSKYIRLYGYTLTVLSKKLHISIPTLIKLHKNNKLSIKLCQ